MKKALVVATVFHFLNFEKNDIKILKNMGYEVHTATNMHEAEWLRDNGEFDDVDIIRHQVDFSRSPFSKKNIVAYKQINTLLREYNFDIVHCHTPVASAIVRLAARKKEAFIIYTCHGFHFNKKSSIKDWLIYYPIERILASFTDMIITINKEDYELASSFSTARCRYIPGIGVDVEKIRNMDANKEKVREQYGICADSFVVLTIGELSDRKNQEVIIRAIAELNEPSIQYVMCGTGKNKKKYQELVEHLGIQKQVIFLGQLSHDQICKLVHCVDVGAIPSKIEGLGLAGIEMLSAGRPLVGSDLHGIKDYLIDGYTGLSTDTNDYVVYANMIKKLKEDKTLYRKCSANAEIVAKKFDVNISIDKMKENYILAEEAKKNN